MSLKGQNAWRSRWKPITNMFGLTIFSGSSLFFHRSSWRVIWRDSVKVQSWSSFPCSWRSQPFLHRTGGWRYGQNDYVSASSREPPKCTVRWWTTCQKCMLRMKWSLIPLLSGWGSLSHRIGFLSGIMNWFGRRSFVVIDRKREYVIKGNFIKTLQDSICQGMHSLCALDKHTTGEDLVRHASFSINTHIVLLVRKGMGNGKKYGSCHKNRNSPATAAIYLKTYETSPKRKK